MSCPDCDSGLDARDCPCDPSTAGFVLAVVRVALEAWHPTDPADRDNDCSACDEGATAYGWYVLSRIKPSVEYEGRSEMESLNEDPISERPSTETMQRVATLLAREDEDGLCELLREMP